MRVSREDQLRIESRRLEAAIDAATGQTAAERRAALDRRIAERLAAVGRDHYRPHVPSARGDA
jgi:hypothetical protein